MVRPSFIPTWINGPVPLILAEIQFMELPALRRYIRENMASIQEAIGKNRLLEWLVFIDDPESEFAKMAETENEVIGRARDMLNTLSKDEKLQEEYMAREKAVMDKYSALSLAEERGEKRGERKGKNELLWQQIKKKFPELDESYYEKIKALDEEKIEAISLALLDMTDSKELEQYLS